MSILNEIGDALQKGKAKVVKELVDKAVAEGLAPKKILDEGLLAGMDVIGEKFKNNEIYVPEVLIAARAMNAGTEVLKPLLVSAGVKTVGKGVIGTVKGDLHDIGKNLVKLMMEGKGIEMTDHGVDVTAEDYVGTAKKEGCQIIACSAMLTTTLNEMKRVVELATKEGIRDKVFIMVGGSPVTQTFCDSIGADCYTTDASSAAEAAMKYLKK